MLLDRLGDARLLALGGGVIAAHQALQLGELADHLGDEIGLGEPRGARGELDVGPDLRRDLPRQRLDPLDPLGLRAELLVEDDAERLELGEALVERLFGLVLVVGQVARSVSQKWRASDEARAHDARVAGGDRRAAVAGDEVRDQDEAVGELAVGVSQDETFLVGADGGADRPRAECRGSPRSNSPISDDRPFDQARDLFEQALVLDERRARARRRGSWRRRG